MEITQDQLNSAIAVIKKHIDERFKSHEDAERLMLTPLRSQQELHHKTLFGENPADGGLYLKFDRTVIQLKDMEETMLKIKAEFRNYRIISIVAISLAIVALGIKHVGPLLSYLIQ